MSVASPSFSVGAGGHGRAVRAKRVEQRARRLEGQGASRVARAGAGEDAALLPLVATPDFAARRVRYSCFRRLVLLGDRHSATAAADAAARRL